MNKLCFSDSDILSLQKILESKEQVPIICHQEISGIWLQAQNQETELRLLLMGQIQLTVSRVCLVNKRQGTMTTILEQLVQFCQLHRVRRLVVQCVQTAEMAAWCHKNGFMPAPYASFETNGIILGDYQKNIEIIEE